MDSVQAPLGYKYRFRQDDDEACPPDARSSGKAGSPHARCIRFEPIKPAFQPEKSVFTRLCRPIGLNRETQRWEPGACSLGQDAALKIGNRFPCPFLRPTGA
jgi:hypothetical protein